MYDECIVFLMHKQLYAEVLNLMKTEYLKVHEEHLKSKDDHKKALKEYWISKYVKTCNKINNKTIQ